MIYQKASSAHRASNALRAVTLRRVDLNNARKSRCPPLLLPFF